ncbi:MAG TPA: ATP-binding protein, partial [Thermoanaerobaculia bacterium]|nr:ATP-binding protein [Thermoanaerobaculia bacterium]
GRLAEAASERALFEAALQSLPAGVIIAEAPSGRVILSNAQAARILKRPPASEIAEYGDRGFHPDGRPYERREWPLARAILFGEEVAGEEIHFVAGDGSIVVASVSAAPIRDARGRIVSGVVAFFDVTREREAERALKASEARVKRLFESNILGILYSDANARLTGANDALLSMIGRSREDLERGELNWMEMTPEDWREADQRAVVELISTGVCTPYEKEYLRGDGSRGRVPVLIGAAILPETQEAVGFVLDLTERKRAEERLELLAKAGRALSESLEHDPTLECLARLTIPRFADYCLVFELQGRRELRQVAARHADPVQEPLLDRLGEIYERSPENPASSLWRVARTGKSELVLEVTEGMAETVTGDPDLLEVYHRLAARSFMVVPLAARSEILGVMLLATARSGRMFGPLDLALGEELASRAALALDNARLYGQAQAASRAKDHFLAALSHELRTPLTPVLLKTAMLRESPDLAPEIRTDLRMIQRNVELEAKLIDDLLDLTRITRGKLALHREVTDVHLLLDHVVKICADDVAGKRLHVDLRPEARERYVWADEARLQQVFWNLLKNAVKFTPAGGGIEIRTVNEEPGSIRIDVIDRGIGIEPETLPRLFSAFEQGDATITRTFGGLGLGLAICKALVDRHGGTLSGVSAGRGKGATFTVVLETVSTPSREQRAVAVAPTSAQRPLRLLLVEDHEPTLEVMTALLEAAGHQVKAARDLASGRRLAAAGDFDLLVSDLGLPDGSGLDLMRELHERYGLRGIAVSGYGMEEDLRRSRDAGFAEHLVKPVDPAKLKAAIARAAEPL